MPEAGTTADQGPSDRARTNARPRWRWVLTAVVASAVLLALIINGSVQEGPNQTVKGTVTTVELNRLCVAGIGESPTCVLVEAPPEVADLSVGDCVVMVYSPEHILVSVTTSQRC